jgi:hypothetical protein
LHEALQLFIDGFIPAGGFRLLRIARPSVLNYGLYGPSEVLPAERRLIELANHRGALARELDCLTECQCDADHVHAQIVLDKMLYDIDRAIDYYSVGDADLGLPEARAAAYSHLLDYFVLPVPLAWQPALARPAYLDPAPPAPAQPVLTTAIREELTAIRDLLRPQGVAAANRTWATTQATYDTYLNGNQAWLAGAPTTLRFAQVLHDELCLQRDTDQGWRAVVTQMTSGCIPAEAVFGANGCLPAIVDQALLTIDQRTGGAVDAACEALQTIVPPHHEESLELISNRV